VCTKGKVIHAGKELYVVNKCCLLDKSYLCSNIRMLSYSPRILSTPSHRLQFNLFLLFFFSVLTGYSEEKAQDMDAMITKFFKDDLSFVVIDKDLNKVRPFNIS